MKISFCMPSFNKELYINDAITSILGQDYKDIELIIVDDASTDGTEDVCKYYTKMYPGKVKYFKNKKNLGVGRCRNIAWSKATGDIICVNDADDLSFIHRAKTTAKAFKNNKIDILYGGCMAINHNGENDGYKKPDDFNVSRLKKENYINHPTVAYRRDISIRYRNVRFIDDWYFYLDCVNAGLKFGKIDDIVGVYRLIHDGLTQDGGFYHIAKEKAKQKLINEFKDFYEDISDKSKKDPGQKVRIKAILKEIPKGTNVLDIGCNGGYTMERIKKKGCFVWGVELSDYLAKICDKKGLIVWKDDVLTLKKIPSLRFDVILFGDILEHYEMNDVLKIIHNVSRLLKRHGKLVITVPYKYGRHAKRWNPDHVRDYDIEDFKLILSGYKMKSKVILVENNAIPDWILITGQR